MTDRLVISRDWGDEYRWERTTRDGRCLAVSGEGYDTYEECVALADSVNAKPYTLYLDESIEEQ